jgi:hypothetical protein
VPAETSAAVPGDAATAAADASAPAAGNADLTVVKVSAASSRRPESSSRIQFAALAESLEATFYDQALKKFSGQSFTDAGYADGQAIFDSLG